MTTQQFFTSHGYVPGNTLSNSRDQYVDLSQLPAFLRSLLVTDGTVTKAIEAYYWEPVAVSPVSQRMVLAGNDVKFMQVQNNQPLLQRIVKLVGENSKRTYAMALSYVRTDQLPEERVAQLEDCKIGIGELLRESELESYREIVDFGIGAADAPLAIRELNIPSHVLHRSYRVLTARQPIMQITEYFPIDSYVSAR